MTGHAKAKKISVEQQPAHVLVVDDQLPLLRSVQALLRINGYQVELATSGEEAIEKLEEQSFHLILLDLQMPGISGFEVLEHVQKNNLDSEVIIISGDSHFKAMQKAMRLGAYDFIRKPYAPEELLESVAKGLERNQESQLLASVEHSLTNSERIHRFIVNNCPDFIYMLNSKGCFTYLNNKVESLLGYKRHELLGCHFSKIIHPHNADAIHKYFSEQRTGARAAKKIEMRLEVNPDNERVPHLANHELIAELNAIGVYRKDSAGKKHFTGTLGCVRDISEWNKTGANVSFQAYHDTLTLLPNRLLFDDRLTQAIAHARRSGENFALMFIDLDGFKQINDTLGHVFGDLVLQQVSERLLNCLRAEDTLSRFGGDEFSLLLSRVTNHEGVAAVAGKILEAVRSVFTVNSHELYLSMSVGIAIYPEDGESRDILLQNADIAMYHVKQSGKDGYCFYRDSMQDKSDFFTGEREIYKALEQNQFQVFFQPKVDSSSNRIVAMEALLRWQHPERGLLYPDQFLPAAEASQLIIPLGYKILQNVCREIVRWKMQGLPKFRISLNLSPVQLAQDDFVDRFIKTIQHYHIAADTFELEISEQGLLKDLQTVSDKLKALRNFGVSVTLDDFGRGHSSFSYLQNFPVNTLKIDRSFVREINTVNKQPLVADGIAMLAKGMHLKLAAEGVENQCQLKYLHNLGCREVQGYLYAEALDPQALLNILKSHPHEGPHFTLQ